LKALALKFGVHGQRCAQSDQDKISVCLRRSYCHRVTPYSLRGSA